MKEYQKLKKRPVPNIICHPSKHNMLKWYFMLHSMDDDYKGGLYIGKIVFPSDYPFKAPDIIFKTPNGRFQTDKKICLSFTSYHPESWDPSWTMENMLLGIISFMYEKTHTTGAVSTSSFTKKKYARESAAFNLGVPEFREIFLDDIVKLGVDLDKAAEQVEQGVGAGNGGGGGAAGDLIGQFMRLDTIIVVVLAIAVVLKFLAL